jgi:hypothetical protein
MAPFPRPKPVLWWTNPLPDNERKLLKLMLSLEGVERRPAELFLVKKYSALQSTPKSSPCSTKKPSN